MSRPKERRATNQPWLLRAAACGTAFMLLTGVATSMSIAETSATWKGSQDGGAAFSAKTAPRPANLRCDSSDSQLGGPVAKLSWSPATGLPGAAVSYKLVGKQKPDDPAWTDIGDPKGLSYSFDSGLLGGLLGGILNLLFGSGNEITVAVVAVHAFPGGVWESTPSASWKIRKAQGGALGLIQGYACTP